MTPPVNDSVCVPSVAVRVPTPGAVDGTDGSVQLYVATPFIFNPSGRVPGRRFENATALMAAAALLFDSVISSCVVSPGLIDVGWPVTSVTDVPNPAIATLL